ncbi:MAG: 16S rRNA (guanine(966)-N(2))-methyltransferase RsmD [Candidatus Omnitrophica bacterium CG11_big_fil_rev_8_21_14_0_20_42_13]|uniref:16S rRNA (Guanine(966)-N(2))-methyltransferase RsmD n=1 Tax=Candidatus Ghiorseimicrobium undicola TaxID=1974746 RepID=A0A2H0LVW6_9BACT|nr:MAG: 16S rRNA (guanine(966)-N(2))-methyltransferase RsmD [Candidatus Omnitrophica bacterium CG11_big_fil_rev_8_21_14_0_20_42_13]
MKYKKSKISKGIRPTEKRVKEALFNILGDISGLSFLDLFAGTGSVGLKAASCGAKEVLLVESDRGALKSLQERVSKGQFHNSIRILSADVFKILERLYSGGENFDIIFLDPPYYNGLAKKTLQTLDLYDILTPSGFIIVQHYKKDILPESLNILTLYRQYRYGDTVLSLYGRK